MVIGQTQAALQSKNSASTPTPQRTWHEASFVAALAERCDAQGLAAARAMIDWMNTTADSVTFNTSVASGSLTAIFVRQHVECRPLAVSIDGSFCVQFEYMKGKPVFGDLGEREELLRRLNEIPGISLPIAAASGRKTMKLSGMTADAVSQFLGVMDWFVARWRTA